MDANRTQDGREMDATETQTARRTDADALLGYFWALLYVVDMVI